MSIHLRLFITLTTIFLLCTGATAQNPPTRGAAQDKSPRVPPPPPLPAAQDSKQGGAFPALEKIAPRLYRFGAITISKDTNSVSFPAAINMERGALEYLLVRKGGKTHESLLRTEIDAAQLQFALLLVGLEGTEQPLSFQGDAKMPQGTPVEIVLNYLQDGRMLSQAAERFVDRTGEEKGSTTLSWIFTGSQIRAGRFLAQAEGSLIALYHDPAALVDNASPGGDNDKIWRVKEGVVPAVGTPVTVIIAKRAQK